MRHLEPEDAAALARLNARERRRDAADRALLLLALIAGALLVVAVLLDLKGP